MVFYFETEVDALVLSKFYRLLFGWLTWVKDIYNVFLTIYNSLIFISILEVTPVTIYTQPDENSLKLI